MLNHRKQIRYYRLTLFNLDPNVATDDIAALTKFCSIDTGLKILNSRALRWSSPALFADPFEPDHHSGISFTQEMLLKAVIKHTAGLLFGRDEPTGRNNPLIAAIVRWRDEERFTSEEEAEEVLKQLLGQLVQQHQGRIDEEVKTWQQFAQSLRICCFCDKPGNMSAWQRYADNHAGLALKFSVADNTPFKQPARVNYTSTAPDITSLQEQIDIIFGRKNTANDEALTEKLLMKNPLNKAEHEWRCFSNDDAPQADDSLLYTDRRFSAADLKAVYMGLSVTDSQRQLIINALRRDYQQTRLFQATVKPGLFELDFVQVSTR